MDLASTGVNNIITKGREKNSRDFVDDRYTWTGFSWIQYITSQLAICMHKINEKMKMDMQRYSKMKLKNRNHCIRIIEIVLLLCRVHSLQFTKGYYSGGMLLLKHWKQLKKNWTNGIEHFQWISILLSLFQSDWNHRI